jgi:hypothetical protein
MFSFYDLDQRGWKRWRSVADQCQRRLTEQQITLGNPGTILRDVDTLLEFVGPSGIVTKGRNASLPSERLPELNLKSSHPIELVLKRALLRDYPNLAGIFILLRVMDLLQMKGRRLVVCSAALAGWRGLNCTEQYFALLEAFLFHAESSVLGGERRHEEARPFEMITLFLGQLSARWRSFEHYESVRFFGLQGKLPSWSLFVQQQLGLIELRPWPHSERERWGGGGRGWLIGGARLTPWGTAAAWELLEFLKYNLDEDEVPESSGPAPDARGRQIELGEQASALADELPGGQDDHSGAAVSGAEAAGWEQSPEEEGVEPDFGTLLPIFQPYFPEWQKVYARPGREVRSGTHLFKVTLAGWRGSGSSIWRRLAVPPDTSLDGLAGAILRAFKFDDDHMYDFRYRDQRGKNRVYNHPDCDEGPWTPEIAVGETDLALKDAMRFMFDYGDDWEFEVRLEKIEAGACRLRQSKVIESAGKAPKQYAQFDE